MHRFISAFDRVSFLLSLYIIAVCPAQSHPISSRLQRIRLELYIYIIHRSHDHTGNDAALAVIPTPAILLPTRGAFGHGFDRCSRVGEVNERCLLTFTHCIDLVEGLEDAEG